MYLNVKRYKGTYSYVVFGNSVTEVLNYHGGNGSDTLFRPGSEGASGYREGAPWESYR